MKQSVRRKDQGHLCKESARPAAPQTQRLSGWRSLGKQRRALNDEEQCRPAITAAGGKGYDEIVDEAAQEESNRNGPPGTRIPRQGLEQETMGDVSERCVPAFAPEFADAGGPEGFVHQRPSLNSAGPPRATQEMK